MPINKDAMLRYLEIDRCLRNTGRKYGIKDLIAACNTKLNDRYGDAASVSRRQIYYDIDFMMSSDGWSAPIEKIRDGRNIIYMYEDSSYSINNQGLNDQELNQLKSGMLILQRFKGIPQFEWVNEILSKLESSFEVNREQELISFQNNEFLKGLEHLNDLFNAIVYKQVLKMVYQPFKSEVPLTYSIHPYYLKQFNNRWFLFALTSESDRIVNLPLDRIKSFSISNLEYRECEIDWLDYFDEIYGVSRPYDEEPENIELWFSPSVTPYIRTKPMHPSQKLYMNEDGSSKVILNLIPNFEFKRLLLSHSAGCKVIQPETLQEEIRAMLELANALYD